MATQPDEVFPRLQTPPPSCSYSECTAGHRWAPRLAIAACPGCAAPILATEMVNCPVCNEPTARTVLRTEHMSRAMGVQQVCKGEASRGESSRIVAERTYWTETEGLGGPRSATEREAVLDELAAYDQELRLDAPSGVVCPDERVVLASGGESE